jgi:hypothetical protein
MEYTSSTVDGQATSAVALPTPILAQYHQDIRFTATGNAHSSIAVVEIALSHHSGLIDKVITDTRAQPCINLYAMHNPEIHLSQNAAPPKRRSPAH